MGVGAWLERKIGGVTPEEQKIRSDRKRQLNKELEDIRWNTYVTRKKLEATKQNPDRLGRVVDALGKAGEISGKMGKGAMSSLSGGNDFDIRVPNQNEGLGVNRSFDAGFSVRDPLSFDSFGDSGSRRSNRKRRKR